MTAPTSRTLPDNPFAGAPNRHRWATLLALAHVAWQMKVIPERVETVVQLELEVPDATSRT